MRTGTYIHICELMEFINLMRGSRLLQYTARVSKRKGFRTGGGGGDGVAGSINLLYYAKVRRGVRTRVDKGVETKERNYGVECGAKWRD